MSDGSINFDTKINTDGIKEGTDRIKKDFKNIDIKIETKKFNQDIKEMSDELDKVTDKLNKAKDTYSQAKSASKSGGNIDGSYYDPSNAQRVMSVQEENIQNYSNKIAEIQNAMNERTSDYQSLSAQTAEYQNLTKEIDTTKSHLEDLISKQDSMKLSGVSDESAKWKSNQADIEITKEKLSELSDKMNNFDSEGATALKNSLDGVSTSLKNLGNEAQKTDLAKSTEKETASASLSLGKLGKSIFSVAHMVKYRFVRMAISSIVNTIKSGFTNLSNYSEQVKSSIQGMKNSVSYLGNSLAAAFAPIITAIGPILSQLCDWLATAMDFIARFFAMLGGKSTYTRAVKQNTAVSNSISGTGSSAKDATKEIEKEQKALAGFDEINQLNLSTTDDSSSSGGSGSSSGTVFEEASTGLGEVTNKLKELLDLFNKGFTEGLGDSWNSRLDDVQKKLQLIKESAIDIATDPRVSGAFDGMIDSLALNLGRITGSITSIGLSIGEFLIGGIAKYLDGSKDFIKKHLASLFTNAGSIFDSIGQGFAGVSTILESVGSDGGQSIGASLIGAISNTVLGMSDVLLGIGDTILNFILSPITDNADAIKTTFEGLFSTIGTILEPVFESLTWMIDSAVSLWDESLKPVLDSMAESFSTVFGGIFEAWNTYVQPILDAFAIGFVEAWQTSVQPALEELWEFLEPMIISIFDGLSNIWNTILVPLFSWLTTTLMPILSTLFSWLGGAVNTVVGIIGTAISTITNVLKGLSKFLTGVFTLDWQTAWQGLSDVFKGIWNGIVDMLERAVNWIVDCLNLISFDVPYWVPLIGGTHFGFNIGHISIPRLATGTVIPPNAGEFAAILGDNKTDTEVVSPLETMKEAMIEALKESGSTGNQQIVIKFDGDLAELARILKPEIDNESKRVGTSLVTG